MNMFEIDPVRFDDFVLDCADAAVALEIRQQQQEAQKRCERNASLSRPPPTLRPINPYAQKSSLSSSLQAPSFKVSVFSPDDEVPFRMDYAEARRCELQGVSGIPRKVWLHTTLHLDGKNFYSYALDTVDEYIYSRNPTPKFERRFIAEYSGGDILDIPFSSDPAVFDALDTRMTPQLNKCLTSARDLMVERFGEDRIKADARLRGRLEREVVKKLPISTAEMNQIAQRSVRRGRIDFPNILNATLPHTLIDQVRAILGRV